MHKEPLVSVVTPCYNGQKYLRRFFESLINQTYCNIQVIFVNDGSTDNTEKIAKDYGNRLIETGKKFVYLYQQNEGQAAAINRALKHIQGSFFVWPDADDELTNDSIEEKVRFLSDNEEYDFCVSKAISIDEETGKVIGLLEPGNNQTKQERFEKLLWGNGFYVSGSYMARTEFLDKVIKGRTIFTGRGGQNAQLLIPMTWFGNLGYIDDVLYRYYIRENSHSHSAISISETTVQQQLLFEKIVIETLERIDSAVAHEYIPKVKAQKARIIFGHALDTKERKIIMMCLKKLRDEKEAHIKDYYLAIRYSSKILNMLKPVD